MTKMPEVGDYWCMGLLTSDLLEALEHAAGAASRGNFSHPLEKGVAVYKYEVHRPFYDPRIIAFLRGRT